VSRHFPEADPSETLALRAARGAHNMRVAFGS
jgi:hypothetical protein